MPKTRKRTPSLIEKEVYQEANSTCAFCIMADVASLQVHHIDGDPSNISFSNLLLTCGNCHTKITAGDISEAEVRRIKEALGRSNRARPSPGAVSVNIKDSSFKGDIAHTMTKIVSPHQPRIRHPEGSIGADLSMKGYIDYLIRKYYGFRKADASYGREGAFSHAVLHSNIQRHFGHKTFFLPVNLFRELADYLKRCIDRTIQGKANAKRGVPNYHSYEEHLERYSK